MAIDVGEIVATLKADTKNFSQGMQRSNTELLSLGAGSVALGNIATEAFNHIASAVFNTVGAVGRWAQEAASAAERTELLSMKLGISEKTLEGWGVSMARVGLDQEALAGGMRTLSKQLDGLSSGSEKSVELFGQLNTGLTATELASMGTEKAIRVIADRFSGMSDGAEKARLAQELLGRAGLQLLPVLNQGSAGLDRAAKDAEQFGLILTDTQRGALKRYDDALDNMGLALQGFRTQVAASFAPTLTRSVEYMTSAVSYAKTVWVAFTDAAEKLFVRFGAIVATIELVGKQLFSLSALNKEAWEQTLNQVSAIDKWAAAEIKAIDVGKNAEVQMSANIAKTKEYTVSQAKLGEAIVASTQIQVKMHQDAKDAAMARMNAEIEIGQRQKAYSQEVSKEFFSGVFEEEARGMKDAYAGSAVMIENVTTKQKALRDMHSDMQKGIDALTESYIEQGMAADAALVAETAAAVAADGKAQEALGRFIVQQSLAKQTSSTWSSAYKIMEDSASFAFGSIRAQFANTVVGLVQGTATWSDFWKGAQGSILNAAVQMGIQMVASMALKNAAILAGEMATAGGVTAIWTATSGAVLGAFGAMATGITGFFSTTIMPMLLSLGKMIVTFLTGIASSLTISIFGAPFAVPVWAAVGVMAAAIGALAAYGFGAFAEGGIVTKPTLGLIGEAGESEAIIPLSKLGSMMGGGQSTVIVELDGRTIARSVFDHMPGVMRVRGISA